MINKEDFNKMRDEFVATQGEYKDEFYGSPKCMAMGVLDEVYTFLFGAEDDKDSRRAMYEELKKEFE